MDIIYEAHEEYRQSDADYYGLKFTGKQQITDELLWQSDCSVCNKIFKSKHIKDNNIYFLVIETEKETLNVKFIH